MSGFVAVVHADGRSVSESLLSKVGAALAYRGPDGVTTLSVAGAALAHAALATGERPPGGPQPLLFDGRLCLVADARLDGRDELVSRLAAGGHAGLDAAPDEVLLAHAYDVWGVGCAERLLGDFSFVIWDVRERQLFGARDPLGVKPLMYAMAGNDLLASNTLEALRAHPRTGDELDELALGDFLLFGVNRHAERTSFAAIRRLPPAHALRWQPGDAPRITRYWKLEPRRTLRLADEREYVERFEHLLRRAVADRVRGGRVAVLMSGGLDSTSVAAVAGEAIAQRDGAPRLKAVTFTHERLFDDPEPAYAALAADVLKIPLLRIALDLDSPCDLWGPDASWSAEPTDLPISARTARHFAAALAGTRVILTGQGGDPLLHVTPGDAVHSARTDGVASTGLAMLRYLRAHGHWPRTGLRTFVKRRLRGRRYEAQAPFPPWLRADLIERLGLRQRYRSQLEPTLDRDFARPQAAFPVAGPDWSFMLEGYDPGMTGSQAEHCHPFLDLRVVDFLLSLPVVPWLVEKDLLRRAMRARLPRAVLARRKVPLVANPIHRCLIAGAGDLVGLARSARILAEFVDMERFIRIASRPERLHEWEHELVTRPLGLALWLGRLQTPAPAGMEIVDEPERSQRQKALP